MVCQRDEIATVILIADNQVAYPFGHDIVFLHIIQQVARFGFAHRDGGVIKLLIRQLGLRL